MRHSSHGRLSDRCSGVRLIQDPVWAVDIARAYNSWLHATYMKRNSRILGAALIPIHDVSAAVQEMRRVKNELGMPGAMLPR